VLDRDEEGVQVGTMGEHIMCQIPEQSLQLTAAGGTSVKKHRWGFRL